MVDIRKAAERPARWPLRRVVVFSFSCTRSMSFARNNTSGKRASARRRLRHLANHPHKAFAWSRAWWGQNGTLGDNKPKLPYVTCLRVDVRHALRWWCGANAHTRHAPPASSSMQCEVACRWWLCAKPCECYRRQPRYAGDPSVAVMNQMPLHFIVTPMLIVYMLVAHMNEGEAIHVGVSNNIPPKRWGNTR